MAGFKCFLIMVKVYFIFIFFIPQMLFVCPSVCISTVLRKTYQAKCH